MAAHDKEKTRIAIGEWLIKFRKSKKPVYCKLALEKCGNFKDKQLLQNASRGF